MKARTRQAWLLLVLVALLGVLWQMRHQARSFRRALFSEVQPVALANCVFERVGAKADGGYLVCANLLDGTQAAYSYGIAGADDWGCDVSARLNTRTHEYDCFDTTAPSCAGGALVFHPECVGPEAKTIEGRSFDTVENQIARNGDTGKRLVVKMDVEGAEWESLLALSDTALARIDQLVVEFHGVDDPKSLELMRRLKHHFLVADIHFNNFACDTRPALLSHIAPFPGQVYEILLVNRRLALADHDKTASLPHPLSEPNHPAIPDCQSR